MHFQYLLFSSWNIKRYELVFELNKPFSNAIIARESYLNWNRAFIKVNVSYKQSFFPE